MARTSASTTAIAETREISESSATVVLDNPANASPITGSTGAPQPTTLHGPVESPSTPAHALTAPPARPAPTRQPCTAARRSSHSATYTPASSAVTTKRTTSAPSTAKPHSGWPYGPSAENQNNATRPRKSSLSDQGVAETRYSGSFLSHGLNVKYVHGFRATDSSSGGSRTSSASTKTVVSAKARGRVPTARTMPRPTVRIAPTNAMTPIIGAYSGVLTVVRPHVRAGLPAGRAATDRAPNGGHIHGGSESARLHQRPRTHRRRVTGDPPRASVGRRRQRSKPREGKHPGHALQDRPHDVLHRRRGGAR